MLYSNVWVLEISIENLFFFKLDQNTSGKKLQRQKNVWDLFLFLHSDVLKCLFVLETCFENL